MIWAITMVEDIADFNGFIFAKTTSVFEFSNAPDKCVTIDVTLDGIDKRLVWLRNRVCIDIGNICNRIAEGE